MCVLDWIDLQHLDHVQVVEPLAGGRSAVCAVWTRDNDRVNLFDPHDDSAEFAGEALPIVIKLLQELAQLREQELAE